MQATGNEEPTPFNRVGNAGRIMGVPRVSKLTVTHITTSTGSHTGGLSLTVKILSIGVNVRHEA